MLLNLLIAYLIGCYAWGALMLCQMIMRRVGTTSQSTQQAAPDQATTSPWSTEAA